MTRIEAVRFAIRRLEKEQAAVSVDHKRMNPIKGSEELFWELEEALVQLKATCQAMQAEGVRKSLAEWDESIAEAVEPEMRL